MSERFVVQQRAVAERLPGGPRRTATEPGAAAPAAERRPAGERNLIGRHPTLAPLARYLDDPEVTDLFVNGASGLFVDRGAGAERIGGWRAADAEVRALAVSLIGLGGRHLDDLTPKLRASLADMPLVNRSRLSVQPVTPAEWKEVCRMGGL